MTWLKRSFLKVARLGLGVVGALVNMSMISITIKLTLLTMMLAMCSCTIYKRPTYMTNWEGQHIHRLLKAMGDPTVAQSDHYLGQILTYRVKTLSAIHRVPKITFYRFWIDRYGYIYRWRVE